MNIKIISISAKSVMVCTAQWAEHVAHMQKRSSLQGFGGET
jgi:hypothetical protein